MDSKISMLLRQLEAMIPKNQNTSIEIPNGVIRTVKEIMKGYTFVSSETIRSNIAYSVETIDFFRWLLSRFKIYGPVKSYIYKITIVLAYMIVEALVMDFLTQQGVKPSKKLNKNIPKLQDLRVSESLCEKIQKLHDRRANIHLNLVSDLEANKYNSEDWKQSKECIDLAKRTFTGICSAPR